MIKEVVSLYEQVRQQSEAHLKHEYRVTKIKAYALDMEYQPTEKAYGEVNPPVFLLAHVDMSFKVSAVKLPLKYDPDEAELTVDLIQDKLIVRKVAFTQKNNHGWVMLEQEG